MMRHLGLTQFTGETGDALASALRRVWILEGLTLRKAHNATMAALAFARKNERSSLYPPSLKVDLSPMCNLRCSACVHASPQASPRLEHIDGRLLQTVPGLRRFAWHIVATMRRQGPDGTGPSQ